MRWLFTHISALFALALPALAQVNVADANGHYLLRTTTGCLYRSHIAAAAGQMNEWTGACTPGAFITGAGTMIEYGADDFGTGVRNGLRIGGTLKDGYWHGRWEVLSVTSRKGGAWMAGDHCGAAWDKPCEPLIAQMNMGCLDSMDWCVPGASALLATPPAAAPASGAVTRPPPAGEAGNSRLVRFVTQSDMQSLVTEAGHTLISSGEDGPVSVRASTTSGLVFELVGTACNSPVAPGCLGIRMQVRFKADGRETLERLNTVNLMWPAISAWYAPAGKDGDLPLVGITRYVILDSGVTRGNIRENLVNLLEIAPQAADYIWQTGAYAPQ